MNNIMERAIDVAEQDLQALGLPEHLSALHSAQIHIKRHILGGSHSVVTYPPLNALQPITAKAIIPDLRFSNSVNVYVHIAYCETWCTFCHYLVKVYRGAARSQTAERQEVERYLKALHWEIRRYATILRQTGTSVSSIYIGGGTPLILEQEQLGELIDVMRAEFDIEPDAEFCVEGSPLTITAKNGEDKLRFLQAQGVTRFSFGVQSFDNEVLKMAARGYTAETAIEACTIAAEVFDNWNIDLMQSLCKGNLHEVWTNLQTIREIMPAHLTYYHSRFSKRPQGSWLLSRTEDFENEWDTLRGRMMIWRRMNELGYRQIDGNRFVRSTQFIDPFKNSRTSISNDLIGIGAGAYSHIDDASFPNAESDGWFFRNVFNTMEYMQAVESGTLPIATALRLTPEERLAASYVLGLRTGRRKQVEPSGNHYQQLEQQLRSLGLTETSPESGVIVTRLTRLGQLFEDEILSLFYSPAVLAALATQD